MKIVNRLILIIYALEAAMRLGIIFFLFLSLFSFAEKTKEVSDDYEIYSYALSLVNAKEVTDLSSFETMLKNKPQLLYMYGPEGKTLLMEAIFQRNPKIIKILVDYGADINAVFEETGASVFDIAAASGSISLMQFLIDKDVKLDKKNANSLLGAVLSEKKEAVQFLLDYGIDVNGETILGVSPLIAASIIGSDEIIKSLIAAGADINSQEIDKGHTALIAAVQAEHISSVKLLIAAGVDVNIQNNKGATALMWAASYNKDITQALLTAGADVNIQNNHSLSAVDIALIFEHNDIALLLLNHGAKINKKTIWFLLTEGHLLLPLDFLEKAYKAMEYPTAL